MSIAKCPKCGWMCNEDQIAQTFGFRMVDGVQRRQSYCRTCRSGKPRLELPLIPVQKEARALTIKDFIPAIQALKVFGGMDLTDVPITIKYHPMFESSSGYASWNTRRGYKVRLTLGTYLADQIVTLIHEYCHIWFYKTGHALQKGKDNTDPTWREGRGYINENHGVRFLAMEKAAYEEWMGTALKVIAADYNFGRRQTRIYHQFKAAARMLRAARSVAKVEK